MLDEEEPDHEYLMALAERLRSIAVMHGVDGGDVARLEEIAGKLRGS